MTCMAHKRALVTGASRGLGASITSHLARHGAKVAAVARSEHGLRQLAGAAGGGPGAVLAYPADLSSTEAADRVARRVIDDLGGIDILVNNAGTVEPLGPFADCDAVRWERTMTVNFLAAARLSSVAVASMNRDRWGRIVNISAGAAAGLGIRGASAYSVSKAALEALTRAMQAELQGTGVTVNAVRPGVVATAMQHRMRNAAPRELDATTREHFQRYHDNGFLRDPAEPAAFVVRLLRTEITGQVLDAWRDRALLDRALADRALADGALADREPPALPVAGDPE